MCNLCVICLTEMLFFFYIFLFPSRKRPQEICIAVYDSLPLNSCHHNYFQTFMKALNSTDHCRTFTEKKKKKKILKHILDRDSH